MMLIVTSQWINPDVTVSLVSNTLGTGRREEGKEMRRSKIQKSYREKERKWIYVREGEGAKRKRQKGRRV